MAVTVPIVADFDSSGVERAKASFGSLSTQIGRAFADVRKTAKQSLGDLEQGLEDSRTAGQKLAAQLAQATTKMSADIKRTAQTADNLAQALGPEMAASLGRSGIERLIRDFTRAGLTLDDIDQSAKELADSLRQLDDVNIGKVNGDLDGMATSVRKVGDETDRSRSVMANFTGNALQEVPGVAGAFGPLNTALGQFAEYATEGGISLKGFASAIGPIAAGAIVIGVVTKGLSQMAEESRKAKERTAELAEEIQTTADALEALNAIDRERNQIIAAGFGGTKDITKSVAALGLTVERFNELAASTPEYLQAWIKAQREAGAGGVDYANVVLGLLNRQRELRDAIADSAAVTTVFGFNQEQATKHMASFVQMATAGVIPAAKQTAMAVGNIDPGSAAGLAVLFGNTATQVGKLNDELETMLGLLDLEDAVDKVDDSLRALEDTQQAVADAATKSAEEQEAALEAQSDQLRQTKRDVAEYALEVLGLPEEQVTAILAELDTASAESVRKKLDLIAKLRVATFEPRVKGTGRTFVQTVDGENAYGGGVSAKRTYLVGEQGPELFVPQGAGQIVPNHRLMPAASGGGTVVNVTVNGALDPVSTAAQIRDILQFDADRRGSSNLLGV